ncbi:uncharacterized protein LOC112538710 [Tetranychus urticae]|uniref:uncharacterized protein LOC112538710 n=1 Tax=Tetranychus urticae TaxID=32264 RepID=UPI000D656EF4|nr:uncharacterized protein LOC112538710 [Tetranychus urticae]
MDFLSFEPDYDPESIDSPACSPGHWFGSDICGPDSEPTPAGPVSKPLVVFGGGLNTPPGGTFRPSAANFRPSPSASCPLGPSISRPFQPNRPLVEQNPPKPVDRPSFLRPLVTPEVQAVETPAGPSAPSIGPVKPGKAKNKKRREERKLYLQKQRLEAELSGTVCLAYEAHLQKKQRKTEERAAKFFKQGIQKAAEASRLKEQLAQSKPTFSSTAEFNAIKANLPARQESRQLLNRAASTATYALHFDSINRSFAPNIVPQSATPVEHLHKLVFKQ